MNLSGTPPHHYYHRLSYSKRYISDVDDERFRVQLWKMKELLETQVKKERFWEIDEDFLLEIGTCIGELMFAKLKVMSEQA